MAQHTDPVANALLTLAADRAWTKLAARDDIEALQRFIRFFGGTYWAEIASQAVAKAKERQLTSWIERKIKAKETTTDQLHAVLGAPISVTKIQSGVRGGGRYTHHRFKVSIAELSGEALVLVRDDLVQSFTVLPDDDALA